LLLKSFKKALFSILKILSASVPSAFFLKDLKISVQIAVYKADYHNLLKVASFKM